VYIARTGLGAGEAALIGMDRQTDLSVLGSTDIFRGLSADVLDRIRATAHRRRLARDEVVFHQGDPATSFYVVVFGRLRVSQTTAEGSQLIVRYLGASEIVGYSALSDVAAYPGTVTAVDDSYLIGWSKPAIQQLMTEHSRIAMNAVAILGGRYHETQIRLGELSTQSVDRRLAHTLLRLVRQAGRRTAVGIEISFPLTRQDLAELAGTTLHTVSRTLSTWERQGIVLSGRRRVVVCALEALTTIAQTA
jgi:CRP/FNR family transcriptional regulator, nitrogen oxide reductase regulator